MTSPTDSRPSRAPLVRRLAVAGGLIAAVVVAPFLWSAIGDGATAPATELAPHRVAYALSLAAPSASGGIVAAEGVMATEWSETCDAWTAEQRILLEIFNADGESLVTDTGFTSWEAKSGLAYRFSIKTLKNGEVSEAFRGEARLGGVGRSGEAQYTEPDRVTMKLPAGTVFPMVHSAALVKAALAGKTNLLLAVFDGATKEGITEVSAFIGAPRDPREGDQKNPLTDRRSWPVRLAFFDVGAVSPEPQYELGLRMFENGVSGDQIMDFGDFRVRARLDHIEALPRPKC